jgi:hypothetical protein
LEDGRVADEGGDVGGDAKVAWHAGLGHKGLVRIPANRPASRSAGSRGIELRGERRN